jgi:hypothetical protein
MDRMLQNFHIDGIMAETYSEASERTPWQLKLRGDSDLGKFDGARWSHSDASYLQLSPR